MTPPTLTLVADELIYGRAACGCSPGPPVIGIRNARGVDGEAVEHVVIDRSGVTNQGQVRTPEFSSLVFGKVGVAVTWTFYLRQHHVIPLYDVDGTPPNAWGRVAYTGS